MTLSTDDLEFYAALADERSGGRGWLCPCCEHDEFWILPDRPRSPKCKKCRKVRSVTAGTLLDHTRIPMWCWKDLLERRNQGLPPPTCDHVARGYGIADSSAWHMIQRVFRLSVRPRATGDVEILMLYLRCRRPSKPVSIAAPEPGRPRPPRHTGPGRPPRRPSPSQEARLLGPWLRKVLGGRRRPSLRWYSRWVAAWTAHWTRWERPYTPVPWTRLATSLGPVALRAMDPWLGGVC